MPSSTSFDMDYATAPYIDLASLGLSNHSPSSHPRMAEQVSWHPEIHKADVRPEPPRSLEAARPEPTAIATEVAEPLEPVVSTTLAPAERVDWLLEPPSARGASSLALRQPLPVWQASPGDGLRVDLLPDHELIRGAQLDLLRLLEALRESPGCTLLANPTGESLLPATVVTPLPLAKPRDLAYTLQYTPEPRSLAPGVAWSPVVHWVDYAAGTRESQLAAARWQDRETALPRSGSDPGPGDVPLFPRSERLVRLLSAPSRSRPPEWGVSEPTAIQPETPEVRVPVALRGFHENGLIFRAFAPPAAGKSSAPGWMISLLVALLILLASSWFLQKTAFADRFLVTHADTSTPSDAALGAFPTMAKYVEVTGLRASVDSKNGSDIRYVVVNHSAADLPPFQIKVKVHPRKGNAEIFSFTAVVPGLGPNESREMHTSISSELHSYDVPEWSNMRVEAHVTPRN